MIRNLLVLGVASFLIVSCTSKDKKAEDGAASGLTATAGESGSTVSDKPMSFNPDGSDSGQISGLATVNFEYDRSRLTTSARQVLADNANWIKNNAGVAVQIEGHCDERGSVEYNLSLGERRANAVKNYLVSLGVDSSRLSTISYGEEKLLDMSDADSSHARNRRANFVPMVR